MCNRFSTETKRRSGTSFQGKHFPSFGTNTFPQGKGVEAKFFFRESMENYFQRRYKKKYSMKMKVCILPLFYGKKKLFLSHQPILTLFREIAKNYTNLDAFPHGKAFAPNDRKTFPQKIILLFHSLQQKGGYTSVP